MSPLPAELPTPGRLAELVNIHGTHHVATRHRVHPKTVTRVLRKAGYQWQPTTGWARGDTPEEPTPTTHPGGADMMRWQEQAACAGVGWWLFFPEQGHSDDGRAARQVCNNCPVRQECLDFALRTGQEDGVWGGVTAWDRRALTGGGRTPRADT